MNAANYNANNNKPAETIILDLGALPLAPQDGGGTVSVLDYMNLLGYLDIHIQDDTGVDYIKLNVHTCCKKRKGADLELTKSHNGNFTYGENNEYRLVVSNMGNADATGPITVVDRLPAGMTFVSGGSSPWSCSAVGQTVTCTHPGPLPALTSAPLIALQVAVAPVSEFPGGSDKVTNCATVRSKGDVQQANNADCDETIITTGSIGPVGPITTTLPLKASWNLVSIPVQLADSAIEQVLAPIKGKYDLVFAYDACDTADSWKTYDPTAAPFANDLTHLDETKGFWIHMKEEATLTVSGSEPVSTTIPICDGWNLVGYPVLQNQPTANALNSIASAYTLVYGYDAADLADLWKQYDPNAAPFANDLQDMQAGAGYWIKANQAIKLAIPKP